MSDTSPDVDNLRIALVRDLEPGVRLRLALEASALARRLALTRMRQAHPGLTERELVTRWLHDCFPALNLPVAVR